MNEKFVLAGFVNLSDISGHQCQMNRDKRHTFKINHFVRRLHPLRPGSRSSYVNNDDVPIPVVFRVSALERVHALHFHFTATVELEGLIRQAEGSFGLHGGYIEVK